MCCMGEYLQRPILKSQSTKFYLKMSGLNTEVRRYILFRPDKVFILFPLAGVCKKKKKKILQCNAKREWGSSRSYRVTATCAVERSLGLGNEEPRGSALRVPSLQRKAEGDLFVEKKHFCPQFQPLARPSAHQLTLMDPDLLCKFGHPPINNAVNII